MTIKATAHQLNELPTKETKHDQLVMLGWESKKRHIGVFAHLCINNSKTNLEINGTEEDFMADLEKLGVQKSEVVVAFHAPYLRPLTGYALE